MKRPFGIDETVRNRVNLRVLSSKRVSTECAFTFGFGRLRSDPVLQTTYVPLSRRMPAFGTSLAPRRTPGTFMKNGEPSVFVRKSRKSPAAGSVLVVAAMVSLAK